MLVQWPPFSLHITKSLELHPLTLHLLRSPTNSIHVKNEANTHHIRSYPPWTLNNIFSHFIHLFYFLHLYAPFQLSTFARLLSVFISPSLSSVLCMNDVRCDMCAMRVCWHKVKNRELKEYYFWQKDGNFSYTNTHTLIFTICRVKLETWKEDFPTSAKRLSSSVSHSIIILLVTAVVVSLLPSSKWF